MTCAQRRLLGGSLLTFAASAVLSALAFRSAAPVVVHADRHAQWQRLPATTQFELTRLLAELERSPAAADVLAQAETVTRLSPAERAPLADLLHEIKVRTAALPLRDRETLAQLAPAARAVWLIRELERQDPAGLARLQQLVAELHATNQLQDNGA